MRFGADRGMGMWSAGDFAQGVGRVVGSQKRCLRAPIQIKDLDIFFENTACFLSQKRCPQPRKFSKKLSFGMSRLCLDASAGSLPAGSGRASQSASTIQVGVLADDGLALQFKRRGHRETENVLRVERIAPNVQLSPLSEKVRARRSSFAVFREIGRGPHFWFRGTRTRAHERSG